MKVAAITSRGMGEWSDTKTITTDWKKVVPQPTIKIQNVGEDSVEITVKEDSDIPIKVYTVSLSWEFDKHVREKKTLEIAGQSVTQKVGNLTAQTEYEISAWAKSEFGESTVAFEHFNTTGIRPSAPSLKVKATNQTAVECSWVGVKNVV
ncbi:sortilin-related receptor-like [Aquarana catesbeiana]|uniref:sortilin-related receptor-like n=1 Tax=Aquarana catesbeiana TaxID=8400 RepID=UPI003CC94E10